MRLAGAIAIVGLIIAALAYWGDERERSAAETNPAAAASASPHAGLSATPGTSAMSSGSPSEKDTANKIIAPADRSEVGRCETVRGELSPSSRQHNAWILVQARGRGAQAFYISGQISINSDGEFEVAVEIGGGKGAGVTYSLIVVQTDAEQSRDFGKRWSSNEETRNTTNLGPALPDGVEKLAQVEVNRTRDESCRAR